MFKPTTYYLLPTTKCITLTISTNTIHILFFHTTNNLFAVFIITLFHAISLLFFISFPLTPFTWWPHLCSINFIVKCLFLYHILLSFSTVARGPCTCTFRYKLCDCIFKFIRSQKYKGTSQIKAGHLRGLCTFKLQRGGKSHRASGN